ncbi:SGNH/GDSL hydrolase family protein [Polaromonas sp. OV174]|uniref:SGNH/GDSL hydrolase family protein n=1 Tax=Polaromonas sp. OV174 TaxID=1855300 RepID=UPI0021017902|nr:SGNH/GDSL hydrolase family protein [Polaromonas sp. OV174]
MRRSVLPQPTPLTRQASAARWPAAALAAMMSLALATARAQDALRPVPAPAIPAAAPTPPAPSPAHIRWKTSLSAFAKADQEHPPATQGVLFVGSSSIRMWPQLAQDFRQLPVLLNRGFGGSTLADCSALLHQLVIPYRPRQIVVYAGDNDLMEGQRPSAVLGSFVSLVQGIRAELPDSHIAFISIKPSPSRAALLPQIKTTNDLIERYTQTMKDVRYIDVYSPMLDAQGQPRPELFLPDRLHLNAAGYQLWRSVLAPYLVTPQVPVPAPAPPAAG